MPQAPRRTRGVPAPSGAEATSEFPRNDLTIYRSFNALAESFKGLYKWELIYPKGPWRGLEDVEFATLSYVDWFNHRRLHGEITNDARYVTPAEFEETYYRQKTAA